MWGIPRVLGGTVGTSVGVEVTGVIDQFELFRRKKLHVVVSYSFGDPRDSGACCLH